MKKIIHSEKDMMSVNDLAAMAKILNFSEAYLRYVISRSDISYREIKKVKKDGTPRSIFAPLRNLKGVQVSLVYNYLKNAKIPSCVYGCGPKKSIIENAMKHSKGKWMINYDISNFFPNVHHKRILQLFIDLKIQSDVAKMMCRLVTRNYALPQGAPTSPYLSSLVLDNLDRRLSRLAHLNRVTYTRYFDDITLSGHKNVFDLGVTVEKIVKTEGYSLKVTKKHKYDSTQDKKVTGIIIKTDGILDVEGKNELRDHLLKLKSEGFSHINSTSIEKERLVLQGKIAFFKSVNPSFADELTKIFKEISW